MKATIMIEKKVNVKTLKVSAHARYWEDSIINGECAPEDGKDFPCKDGDNWCPIIDIDTGIITNWTKGVTAEIHFKVCDCGSYYLIDDNGDTVLSIKDDYVPRIMCPKENGYGDYIIMDIDENGQIQDWKTNISDFYKQGS